ncbi:DNA polymerase III subunit gamma/tau [Parahaliea mediterranea]|uniref:DNA polymerase III subunit gamma/tau n=1 Tax=Parahaliea mediterranea TaxID=651086 RepID=A0A939IK42_9GAMM|nr:DNA polymerase III subunit gamma/tau [Parahaliea mediterranea]MBN7798359.1 DNA polymerase III subunit gamma/tau [Parahaliea mediterranea]
MSYQALARKWRPKSFREMVGQEHVLQALINALDHDRLHHAYLFTGTRGVGKTTIARILAKCLNCEEGVSSEPCGQCGSCREIAEGRSVDLLEVDAASRTKVEDTRELLENVQYAPTRSRYKVYLIDEVHMLSSHSFNALLKTLEEPPPHVKFLLATTDPQKLPATILSRCLQFNLKNMPPEQVVGHLRHVLDKEMVSHEEPALWLLGRAAAGSMRDALSLTDQAIAFGSGALRETEVRSMLGTVDLSFVYQVLEAVVAGDPRALLAVVAKMGEHAPDFESSLDELVSLLHRVAVAQAVPDAVDNNWGDAERVSQLAASMTAEDAQLYYQMAINGKRDIPLAADPRGGFEMTVLRMLAFRPAVVFDAGAAAGEPPPQAPAPTEASPAAPAVGEVGAAVKKPPEAAAPAAPVPAAPPPAMSAQAVPATNAPEATAPEAAAPGVTAPEAAATANATSAAAAERRPKAPPIDLASVMAAPREEPPAETPPAAMSEPVAAPKPAAPKPAAPVDAMPLSSLSPATWPDLLEQLGLVGIVYNIASHCELRHAQGASLEFVLDRDNATLFNPGHADKVRLALQNYFDTAVEVSIEPGALTGETPAQRSARLAEQRQQEAVDAIDGDPVLRQLIERFDGELDRASIAPLDP